MNNKLVIIDGNSLFYRSFYALPLLSNSKGEYSNALYGFAIQVINIIKTIRPTHLVVAFDVAKKTFRNELYSGYKASRSPMPEELFSQFAPLKNMLDYMNIKYCEQEGIEGDDVIGILSDKFSGEAKTIIVTGDRDSFQLIDGDTEVYYTQRGTNEFKVMNKKALLDEYGVTPEQFIDLKALQGDKSDDIPGVAGVGPKTATDLVTRFKNLDNIYNNLDKINPKVKEKLEKCRDMAFLSKKLATILRKGELDVSLEECTYDFPFNIKVYDFFKYYDFRSLLKKDNFDMNSILKQTPCEFNVKQHSEEADVKNLAEKMSKRKYFSIYFSENCVHISCGEDEEVVNFSYDLLTKGVDEDVFFGCFKELIESEKILKICYDSKQVMYRLKPKNINLVNYFDCAIAKYLVDGVPVDSLIDIFSNDHTECIASNLVTFYLDYKDKIEDEKLHFLFYEVEIPLSKLLFEIENNGFTIDKEVLSDLTKKYQEELEIVKNKIFEIAGYEFNLNSPKQLGHLLYEELGLEHKKNMSTNADALQEIESSHEIVPLILRFRKIFKFLSTYLSGMYPFVKDDGKIHTYFKQTLTQTGRLSSIEPNLQNIPIRSEESKEIRSMFVASSKDHVLVDADYSQIELRLLAHMSGDKTFIEAFRNNDDIHTKTATEVFNVPKELVTPQMRRTAKVVNFGIIYGISGFGLAEDLKISNHEARMYIDEFYKLHPAVKSFMDTLIVKARETGKATTLFGRTRRMTDLKVSNPLVRGRAERISQNMPLQGTAADIIKIAMIATDKALKKENLSAKLIMQVHDELIVDCLISEKEKVMEILKREMENAADLSVPLKVDIRYSYRWSDSH